MTSGILATIETLTVNNAIFSWIVVVFLPITSVSNPYIYSFAEMLSILKAQKTIKKSEK